MSTIKNLTKTYFVDNNTRYVFIDGNANDTLEKCYNTLQQQLSFPDYFGKNLDALEEMINDLDWIEEEKIKIIITNKSALLINEKDKKDDFLDIFSSSEINSIEIIFLNSTAS